MATNLETNNTDLLELTKGLEDWFWQIGREREGSYVLPVSGWPLRVHQLRNDLEAALQARAQERPAMAIWGPSQTGKSTLISAYMDAGASFNHDANSDGDAGSDGEGSGLQWPGGQNFFFMAPRTKNPDSLPTHLTRMVLNPYNKGMDGSSCLSRFVPGTLTDKPGFYTVKRPSHPVQLELVTPRDLCHALARGYGSECLGPRGNKPTAWNIDSLTRKWEGFRREHSAGKKANAAVASRKAFEELHAFVGVVQDLATAEDSNFADLRNDHDQLKKWLNGLFEERWLVSDPKMVDKLTAIILWDGCEPLTKQFHLMRDFWRRHVGPGGTWSGKPIFCTLEATALFLNMGACVVSYTQNTLPPKSPEAILQSLISKLGWREENDAILIGCDSAHNNALGHSPHAFSVLQGLVWELTIPVNLDNLPEHPFDEAPERGNALRTFLEVADLLDFPGVGNEQATNENRILTDPEHIEEVRSKAGEADASAQDRERAERCFSELLFFKQIVKRGKTASIVTTYSRRLNIDGFSIFQALRSPNAQPCANADQLINGVRCWWKNSSPEYYRNRKGSSPLPLNLVLTWWARPFNLAMNPNDTAIYKPCEVITSPLGQLRDPEVVTTFAIHDHRSPDPDAKFKQDFSPGSDRYRNLHADRAFAKQFSREISRTSFDSMVSDKLTGGAEFFFVSITAQMKELRADKSRNRLTKLDQRIEQFDQLLDSLLRQPDLYPNPKPKDDRRDHLRDFAKRLEEALDKLEEEQIPQFNYALRTLLDIKPADLLPVPKSAQRIREDHIESQLHQWVSQQKIRAEGGQNGATNQTGNWRLLGITGGSDCERTLTALARSIAPDTKPIADWLRHLAELAEFESADLRRFLAIRLANAITYGSGPPSLYKGDLEPTDWDAETMAETHRPGVHNSPHYRFFVEPFVAPKGQLQSLIEREVIQVKRPDQPGDPELEKLCKQFNRNPLAEPKPAAN